MIRPRKLPGMASLVAGWGALEWGRRGIQNWGSVVWQATFGHLPYT